MISGPAASLRAVWHLAAGAGWDIYVYRSGRLALERLVRLQAAVLVPPHACPGISWEHGHGD